jgi:membrane-bound metal-dependent hydrolase YbcI (DUF457 family)
MKGLAHFVSGIAAASFLPGVAEMSAEGGYPLVLAGLGALLPDVLDFRLARFLQSADVELDVDADRPDAQAMAEQIRAAVDQASGGRRPVILRLPAARTRSGLWRRYTVGLGRAVRVRIGPLVSTSGGLVRSAAADGDEAVAMASQEVAPDYGYAVIVDAFAGPTIALERMPGGVRATFLPWHRAWSHSLLLVAVLALGISAVSHPLYGMLLGTGAVVHIAGDQLGFMGSNLLWPITYRRTRGIGLFHSGDALPNLLTCLLGGMLLACNLGRDGPTPVSRTCVLFGAGAALLLAALTGTLRRMRRQRLSSADGARVVSSEELLAETERELG